MRTITCHADRVRGPVSRCATRVVGAGRAAETLRASFRRQLAAARDACGFTHLRFHGLLEDEMGVLGKDESGALRRGTLYIDECFDGLLDLGIKPFVEFGFMPPLLASGDKTVFWWKGNVTPPADHAAWGSLIEFLVRHWIRRYGLSEVRSWFFEVWNEPNHKGFFTTRFEDYQPLYAHAARAIKSVDAELRVGGPATAGPHWAPEMIAWCHAENIPIDFVSTHHYMVKHGEGLDEFGRNKILIEPDAEKSIAWAVHKVRKEIRESALPHLELHFTEWNSSYSPRDPVHDAYYNAAFILEQLRQIDGAADSMAYWALTDIFEEAGPVLRPLHGGFGLCNWQGLRKPSWYAHSFLHRLGGDELQNADRQSWLCRDGGRIQALVYDHSFPRQDAHDQEYFIRDLPADDAGGVRLRIEGLPPGPRSLRVTRVGYRSNDLFTAWHDLGSPDHLSRGEVADLDRITAGNPELIVRCEVGPDGVWQRDLPLRENDILFIELDPA